MIEELFRQHLDARVLSTVDLSIGVEQEVHKVETDRGPFIIKKPIVERGINRREKLATDLARSVGVPAPQVYWHDESYLIQEFIDGEPLDRVDLTEAERRRYFGQLGEVLGQLHTCGLDRFGPLQPDGRGEYESYLAFYRTHRENKTDAGGFADDRAREYFEKNKHYLDRDGAVLVHFDIEEEHVLVRNGRIVGLVDFASAFAGSPAEEFTRLYSLRWKDPLFDVLLAGYPAIDKEEIEFFTFLHLHWRIPWHTAKGNRPHKILLLTSLYRRLIGRPARKRSAPKV